jgi:hypothetical protein
LPSKVKVAISFSTMHWTRIDFASFVHAMPWHQWPILASVTGARSVRSRPRLPS